MTLSKNDISNVIERYTKRYIEYGFSPKSLGWDKGKQELRFEILTSEYNFEKKHVLDIGCGFGDLNKTLSKNTSSYNYTGIDLVEKLIEEGKKHYNSNYIKLIKGNILDYDSVEVFDYAISSGIFNHKNSGADNYSFIEATIKKALAVCRDGLAFDFLSDKVDYKLDHTFHSSPEKILEIAYKYSRNIILKNSYMPFEFSLFMFKDDSFKKDDTVFNVYKK